jgi:hypothetical protein
MRVACLLALPLAACGQTGPSDDEIVDCSTVTGVDTFVVGLEHEGVANLVDFQLMSVDPAPPQRGDNTWVVQVNAMASGVVGDPIDGAAIEVSSYMPKHKHYSQVTPKITPYPTSGQYEIRPVNLWMTGVWETTITATPAGETGDRAVFKFCIP